MKSSYFFLIKPWKKHSVVLAQQLTFKVHHRSPSGDDPVRTSLRIVFFHYKADNNRWNLHNALHVCTLSAVMSSSLNTIPLSITFCSPQSAVDEGLPVITLFIAFFHLRHFLTIATAIDCVFASRKYESNRVAVPRCGVRGESPPYHYRIVSMTILESFRNGYAFHYWSMTVGCVPV